MNENYVDFYKECEEFTNLFKILEETIRKNFVLIYEIIDEMIDFGYPQLSDTEQVKQFVFTEPIVDLQNINTFKELFVGQRPLQ